jgi:DNA-binding beta-propeller fold protein YncE
LLIGIKMSDKFKILFEGDAAQGWMHSGIAILSDGRLVFEAAGGRGLVFFDRASGKSEKISVDIAVAHGIATTHESGEDFIWICDPGEQAPGKVVKVNLSGKIVDELQPPEASPLSKEKWRPTSVAVTEDGDIWIADGYGLSLVHRYSPNRDVITLDGSESGLKFNCPHGVAVDDRGSQMKIAVADRTNKRVLLFEKDGRYIRSISAEIMTSPSSIAASGDKLFITDLRGAILSISSDDHVNAVIPSAHIDGREGWPNAMVNGESLAPTIKAGEINSPHGIVASKDGSIYATEWFFGGRVITLV